MLSTCMSMPITSSTGRTRPPISRPSCGTSIDCGRGAVWRCGQGRPAQAALATGIRGCAINHPEEVQARLASGQRVQIIDMRPRHYSSRAVDIVEGFCGAIPSTLTTGLARFPRKRRWSRFVSHQKPSSQKTLCWREVDSNFQYAGTGESRHSSFALPDCLGRVSACPGRQEDAIGSSGPRGRDTRGSPAKCSLPSEFSCQRDQPARNLRIIAGSKARPLTIRPRRRGHRLIREMIGLEIRRRRRAWAAVTNPWPTKYLSDVRESAARCA